jgi:predicted RNA-binding Zn ribbon-like protein
MSLCNGTRADGGHCQAQAMRNSEWCINHDPDQAEVRRRRASKGGKRGGRGRPLVELADVKRQLRELADDVIAGRTDKGNAAVAGQLLGTFLRAVSVGLAVKEQEEILERLVALEQQHGAAQSTWQRR